MRSGPGPNETSGVTHTLVVEMCGLPGSGKSLLAGLTSSLLVERGVASRIVDGEISAATQRGGRVLRRLGWAGTELAARPVQALHAARLVQASGQESARDSAAGLVQWLAVQQLVRGHRRRAGVGIVEEGPVQTMWTLGLRAEHTIGRQLWRTLSPAVHADLLCVVDAPVDVIMDRLERRGSRHSRTQQLPADLQRAELRRGELLLASLVRDTALPLLRVHNDGADPHAVAAGIADVVVARLALEHGAGDGGRA